MARLTLPNGGSIKIDGRTIPEAARIRAGRAHGLYRAGDLSLSALSVRDNLLFGLKHRPSRARRIYDEATSPPSARLFWREAERGPATPCSIPTPTGSTTSWPARPGRPTCCRCMVAGVEVQVEFDDEIYSLGLRGTIDSGASGPISQQKY
jgi:putative ABC transport system ATP-binding protein